MTPLIYNVSIAAGTSLVTAGAWLRNGLPDALAVAGATLLALAIFGRWIER